MVNNQHLYDELKTYIERVRAWRDAGETGKRPYLSEHPFLVDSMIQIVNGLARKASFSRYSYLQDMKQDALLTCILYIDRFDPEKSKNAFSYIYVTAYRSFIKRISREKRQAFWKEKVYEAIEHKRRSGCRYFSESEAA